MFVAAVLAGLMLILLIVKSVMFTIWIPFYFPVMTWSLLVILITNVIGFCFTCLLCYLIPRKSKNSKLNKFFLFFNFVLFTNIIGLTVALVSQFDIQTTTVITWYIWLEFITTTLGLSALTLYMCYKPDGFQRYAAPVHAQTTISSF